MFRTKTRLFRLDFLVYVAALLFLATLATPQTIDPFENGWTLDAEGSELNFMSIKKGDVAEDSRFATLSGLITEDGKAQIRVLMDSVDTHVDLRNVRMRFLFFESFKYPEALITAQLDPATLQDLHQTRRKMVEVPFTLDLHGVTVERSAEVAVALIDNDRVNVSTTKPIALKLADFNLEEGRQKLQEAAEVTIVPVGMVSFDFVFNRSSPGTPVATAEVTRVAAGGGASAALETKGAFDREACIGRFEILSRAGNIYFGAGSARLSAESVGLLAPSRSLRLSNSACASERAPRSCEISAICWLMSELMSAVPWSERNSCNATRVRRMRSSASARSASAYCTASWRAPVERPLIRS